VDSSGLRFTYTNQLREYDAGVLVSGVIVNGRQHIIPPNAESFKSYGECSADCLAKVSYMMLYNPVLYEIDAAHKSNFFGKGKGKTFHTDLFNKHML